MGRSLKEGRLPMKSKKRLLIFASVTAAIIFVFSAVSYLTGLEIEKQVMAKLNQPAPLSGGGRLSLVKIERGIFSSNIRLAANLPVGISGELVLSVDSKIEHGPFPLSRISNLQFLPAAATILPTIDSSLLVSGANSNLIPVVISGQVSALYNSNLQGDIILDAKELPFGSSKISLEALKIHLNGGKKALRLKLSANKLALKQNLPVSPSSVVVKNLGATISMDRRNSKGSGEISIRSDSADYLLGGDSVLRLEELRHEGFFDLQNKSLSASILGESSIALWNQPLGKLQQSLALHGVNTSELQEGLRTAEFVEILKALGEFHLSAFELNNSKGQSYLRANSTADHPLGIDFYLSKPQFVGSVSSSPELAKLGKEISEQQANMVFAIVAKALQGTGFVAIEDKGLSAQLELADGGLKQRLETKAPFLDHD
jgi:hypothetical protein